MRGVLHHAHAAAGCPAPAAAEVTIRFPIEYSLDITPGLANQDFKKLVEERSKGRVEVKLFPSGSLYKGLDLLQALLRGDAEMTTLISAYWSSLSPRLAVSELPYAFPTTESFYKAIDDGFFQEAYAEVEGKGAKLITRAAVRLSGAGHQEHRAAQSRATWPA